MSPSLGKQKHMILRNAPVIESNVSRGHPPEVLSREVASHFKSDALRCIKKLRQEGVRMTFNEKGMELLDQIILDVRNNHPKPKDQWRKVIIEYWAIVGETMLRAYGGEWVKTGRAVGIWLKQHDVVVYPMDLVIWKIQLGEDFSIRDMIFLSPKMLNVFRAVWSMYQYGKGVACENGPPKGRKNGPKVLPDGVPGGGPKVA